MSDKLLNEPFETTGEWFLPEMADERIPGQLRFSGTRINLDLHRAFQPFRGAFHAGEMRTYPVIHGISREGEAITLLNAIRANFSFNFGPAGFRQPETLVVPMMLAGTHASLETRYSSFRIRIPALQVWLCRPTIHQAYPTSSSDTLVLYQIKHIPEDKIHIAKIDTEFQWVTRYQTNVDSFSSISASIFGWLEMRPSTAQPLPWLFEQLEKIIALLSFLAGTTMSADCIMVSTGDDAFREAAIITSHKEMQTCKFKNITDFYIARQAIGVGFERLLNTWFDEYEKLQKPSQLAIAVFASSDLWPHVEFLSLLQALEGYHRALFDGHYMPSPEYEDVKLALSGAIPPGLSTPHKDSLRSRIRYGNEISLAKRLNELATQFSSEVRMAIFGGEGSVPRRWIDTRNYYTHWDEALKDNILDANGMLRANVRLRHFLRALYAGRTGVPQSAIIAALGNTSDESQQLIQINIIERRLADPSFSPTPLFVLTQGAAQPSAHSATQSKRPTSNNQKAKLGRNRIMRTFSKRRSFGAKIR